MMKLIDLHCHILSEIDDGPNDLETSIKLAQAAVDQGIENMLLTPHHMDGTYTNSPNMIKKRVKDVQRILEKRKIPLNVFASQEVHLTGELIQAIEDDEILFMDETKHYLLLELPHTAIPEYTEKIIIQLTTRGIVPVIAHPERNSEIRQNPDRLFDLVHMGCLTQLTSGSYLGTFGKEIQNLTEKIIAANLGFTFASDTHNFEGRRFLMKETFDKLTEDLGPDKANQFNQNAKNIINGDDIDNLNYVRISEISKRKKKFWLF